MFTKSNLPADIPAAPNQTYAESWNGWGHWLGTGVVAPRLRQYRPFKAARAYARELSLKNQSEWRNLPKDKLPADIPAAPHLTYAEKGWTNWGDWLGSGTVAAQLRKYRSFKAARTFAHNLELKNTHQLQEYCKGKLADKGELPPDIPANPIIVYANKGWAGMGDWLGTGNIAFWKKEYRPFKEARAFVRGLDLKSNSEWRKFCKGDLNAKGTLPPDIPSNPNNTYVDKGWMGWGDWLGNGNVASQSLTYFPFRKARAFARSLDLKGQDEWRRFCKGLILEKGVLPQEIPSKPDRTYVSKGWMGYGDWLGTGNISNRLKQYRRFDDARAFVRNLTLKKRDEWVDYCKGKLSQRSKLPSDIPTQPGQVYANKGWSGWGDWLGTGRTRVSKSPKRKS